MDLKRLIEWLQIFGVLLVAIALAALDGWLLSRLNAFHSVTNIERFAMEIVAIVAGVTMTLAPYEVSSWTGRYGWTRQTYLVMPEEIVRWCGIAILVGVTWTLLKTNA